MSRKIEEKLTCTTRLACFLMSSYSWLVEARRTIPKNAFIEAELHNPADFAKPLKVTAIELQAQDGESPWYECRLHLSMRSLKRIIGEESALTFH